MIHNSLRAHHKKLHALFPQLHMWCMKDCIITIYINKYLSQAIMETIYYFTYVQKG
jgi:hypothetical protein